MTDDELREALDAVMASPPCAHCGAPFRLIFPRGGAAAIPYTVHDDGCAAA